MSGFNDKKNLLITAGIMLAFCFVVYYSPNLQIFIHELVNIFAGGRSSVKIFLFFGFIVMLCLAALLNKSNIRINKKVVLGLLCLTYAYGLALHLYFIKKLGLSITDFVISFNNQEISSSTLTHTHVMKGVMALVLQWLRIGSQENADTGLAFLNLVHPLLFVVGIVIILLSIGYLIALFLELFNAYKERVDKWGIIFILLYGITSFSLIKNFLDGGILNRETLFSVSALLFIIFPIKSLRAQKTAALYRLSPVIAYILLLTLINFHTQVPLAKQWSQLFQALTYGSILGSLIYLYSVKRFSRPGVLLIIMCALLLYWPITHAKNSYISNNKSLQGDSAYVGLLNPTQAKDYTLYEKIGGLYIYEYTPSKAYSVQELLEQNELLDNLNPVKIPWHNCLPMGEYQINSFELISKQPIPSEQLSNKFINIRLADESRSGDFYRYQGSMAMKPCTPRPINVLEHTVLQTGVKTFFVTNFKALENGN